MSRALLYRAAAVLRPWDAFLARLGLWRAPREVPDEVQALLVAAAERCLRGGAMLSLADWARLSNPERGAFVAAGERIRADLASAVGFASQGVPHALAVHGVLDAGRAQRQVEIEAAAAGIADRAGARAVRR